ncbi:hypothetical protein ABK040_005442 [Willaertia magna]
MTKHDNKQQRKFKRNKKLVKAKIKEGYIRKEKSLRETIKTQKLKEEEHSDSEKEEQELEQNYLTISQKKKENSKEPKETITSEEVADFFEKLKEGDIDMDDDEIEELIAGAEDNDEVYGGEEEKEEETKEDNEEENDKPKGGEEEDDEELEEYFQKVAKDMEEEDDIEEKKIANKIRVTGSLLKRWIKKIKKNDYRAVNHLVLSLRGALEFDNEELNLPYYVPDQATFVRVVMATVKYLGEVGTKVTEYSHESNRLPKRTNWKKLKLTFTNFINAFYKLIEENKDEKLLVYILHYFLRLVPFYGLYDTHPKKILRVMLNLLGHDNEDVRVRAFLIINKMAVVYPYPFLEVSIKGVYYTLLRNGNFYNQGTFQKIDFLKNVLTELCAINFTSTYQHAFVYIRELAITLKRALNHKIQNGYALCYNFKFINCVDAWVKVVSTHYNQENIAQLLYPLTQIIIGAISLNSTAKLYPTRVKFISMLNELSKNTGKFIPISQFIFDILQLRQATHSPKQNQKPQPLYFEFKVKTLGTELKSREFHQRIVDDCCFLLLEHLASQSKSVAFAELSYPITSYLKKYLKKHSTTLHPGISKQFTTLIKHIGENVAFINDEKSKVNFGPLDFDKVKTFLQGVKTPLDKYYETEKKKHDREVLERIASKLNENVEFDMDEDEEQLMEVLSKRKRAQEENEEQDEEETEEPEEDEEEQVETVTKKKKVGSKRDTVKELNLEDF